MEIRATSPELFLEINEICGEKKVARGIFHEINELRGEETTCDRFRSISIYCL